MSARLEEMNTKQDQVLTACGEIALLKDEKRKLRETSAQVKENNEDRLTSCWRTLEG